MEDGSRASTAHAALRHAYDIAYRVPWFVDRSAAPWYSLVNNGDEELTGVHLTLNGEGDLLWRPLLRVAPGAAIDVVVRGDDPARGSIMCVRWFRPNSEEYVWRVSF